MMFSQYFRGIISHNINTISGHCSMKKDKQTRWLQRFKNFDKAFMQLKSVVLTTTPLLGFKHTLED